MSSTGMWNQQFPWCACILSSYIEEVVPWDRQHVMVYFTAKYLACLITACLRRIPQNAFLPSTGLWQILVSGDHTGKKFQGVWLCSEVCKVLHFYPPGPPRWKQPRGCVRWAPGAFLEMPQKHSHYNDYGTLLSTARLEAVTSAQGEFHPHNQNPFFSIISTSKISVKLFIKWNTAQEGQHY